MPSHDDSPDSNRDTLIKTATTLELMNTRLFGGDGQVGALPYMFEQHKVLTEKLDHNKQELMDKIDLKKQETDQDIKEISEKHDKLDKKVNWYVGGITALWGAATLALGWLGIHHKG